MNKTPVDQRLARLQSLFVAALKVSPGDRDRWLTQHHEADDTIVDEVRSLLRHVQRSTDPLEDGVQLSQSMGALLKRAQSRQPGEFIGKFAIKKLLGIGGFGAVYLCFDPLLKRDVAVKIFHAGHANSADRFEKQLIEAQRVAALDCPGIIPIYEGGYAAEGIPYFAMKYIPGQTLYDRIRSSLPTAGESAAILARVAETLSIVHAHGIVHRDLKPTNIILDEQDSPFIADFGLAGLAAEINRDQGGLAGTPSYMAPEQFDATNQQVDARSDIWSLGVILFEMLAGRPPFSACNIADLRTEICTRPVKLPEDPSAPGKASSGLRRISQRCLEKRPDDRYQSAEELATALRQHCPRPQIPGAKGQLWWSVAAILMSLALAAGAIIGSSYWVTSYRAAKQDAERDALAHANRLAEVRYGNDMAQAFEYLNKNWPDQVQSVLDRHRPQAGKPDRRDFAWYFLASMVSKPKPVELAGHRGAVNEMAIFPDRRRVASVGEDGTLRIWDVEAQTCLQTIDLGAALPGIDLSVGGLHSVAVSPDGRYVAAGADVVGICDLERDCEVRELYRTDWNVESLCFSSDGKQIAAGVRYDHVALLSLEGDLLAKIPSAARNEVIQFLEGASQWVITKSSQRNEPRKVQFWSRDFKTLVREQFSGQALFARLESKGDQIALAATGAIKVADMVTESMDSRGEHRAPITDLAFSPDGSRVVSGHGDGMVHVHRLVIADGAIMFDGPALATHVHQGITTGVRFLDDDRLITCGTDGLLRIWPEPTPTSIVKISLPVENVWPASLGFHRKNNLVRIGADQKLIDLDSRSGEMRQFRELGFGGVHVWSDEGDHFANFYDTEFVRVLDHFAHELFHLRPRVAVHDVAFSPTASAIAIPNDDGQSLVEIRRVDDGRIHRALSAPDRVRTMAFSPDGKWLWGVCQDKSIAGWDLSQGDDQRATVLHKTPSPLTSPDAFAINRAGTELATGHQDSVIRIWNLKQRDLVRQLTCIEGNPGQVLFSPDGNCLISIADMKVAVWSLATGQLYGTVDSLTVAQAGFSPHGHQLVFLTCSADGSEPCAIMVDLGEEFASKIQSLN